MSRRRRNIEKCRCPTGWFIGPKYNELWVSGMEELVGRCYIGVAFTQGERIREERCWQTEDSGGACYVNNKGEWGGGVSGKSGLTATFAFSINLVGVKSSKLCAFLRLTFTTTVLTVARYQAQMQLPKSVLIVPTQWIRDRKYTHYIWKQSEKSDFVSIILIPISV